MIDHQAALFERLRAPLPLTSPNGVLAANAGPVAPARDAATVVLLRDAQGGGVEAYRVAAVPAAARDHVIAPILPKIAIADGAVHFLLPHDAEYATAASSADSARSKAMLAAISTTRGNQAAVTASTTVEQA